MSQDVKRWWITAQFDNDIEVVAAKDHDRLIDDRDELIRDLLNQIKTKTIENIEWAKRVGDMAVSNYQNLLEARGHIEMVDRVLSLRIKELEERLKGKLP